MDDIAQLKEKVSHLERAIEEIKRKVMPYPTDINSRATIEKVVEGFLKFNYDIARLK